MDYSNGRISDVSYSSSELINDEAVDEDGNSFSIAYSYAMAPTDSNYEDYYAQLRRNQGYLYSKTPLKLVSITINGVSSGYPSLSFPSSTTFSNSQTFDFGTTYYPSNGETFFRIEAGDKALYIESIEIVYGGGGSPSSSSSSSEYTPTSSTDSSSSSREPSSSSEDSYDHYQKVSSAVSDTLNYQNVGSTYGTDSIPSLAQDSKVLVLPIELSDYPFVRSSAYSSQEQMYDDFDRVFNGSGSEDTGYWESLSSFYEKSSYGKLKFSATIGEIYETGYTARRLYSSLVRNEDTTLASDTILEKAVENYKENHPDEDLSVYDYDGNGFLDAVIMIYSCPDYGTSSTIANFDYYGLYWAYCYWDLDAVASPSDPSAKAYFWASYDFFYEGSGCSIGNNIDSHTLIHEFGHLLGLDDYYDYDGTSSPIGWLNMMDGNILDHDAWSKTALGWTSPYEVTGNAEITINSFQESGDCIILSPSWNGTAFDEFLILELYTPTGLNELDSTTAYTGRPQGLSEAGIKIYHVDSRLVTISYYNNWNYTYEYADNVSLSTDPSDYDFLYPGASNSSSYAFLPSGAVDADLITLLDASNDYGYGSSRYDYATNDCLFQTGDTFTLNKYSKQFPNKTKLNNGSSLDYEIEFVSVSSESATIRFNKTA